MRPIISLTDYNTLRTLTHNRQSVLETKEITQLEKELDKATVINDSKLNNKIVRLNSLVKIMDEVSGKSSLLEIVLPAHADLKVKKISVLAPISIALLGFQEGDSLEWQMPGGLKRIKIISVKPKRRDFPNS
jgi:regulator of nucleoside diphosphate kinase